SGLAYPPSGTGSGARPSNPTTFSCPFLFCSRFHHSCPSAPPARPLNPSNPLISGITLSPLLLQHAQLPTLCVGIGKITADPQIARRPLPRPGSRRERSPRR